MPAYPKSKQLAWNKTDKPEKIKHNRGKPSKTVTSNLSPKETARLKERSNGVCEKCDRQRATHKAHIIRRQHHTVKPVAEDFAHLCVACHQWADGGAEGRAWLVKFGQRLRKNAS